MACESIIDKERKYLVFACNTSDVAFGPLIYYGDIEDIEEVV